MSVLLMSTARIFCLIIRSYAIGTFSIGKLPQFIRFIAVTFLSTLPALLDLESFLLLKLR